MRKEWGSVSDTCQLPCWKAALNQHRRLRLSSARGDDSWEWMWSGLMDTGRVWGHSGHSRYLPSYSVGVGHWCVVSQGTLTTGEPLSHFL